jgi:serine/threonine protein kinase HipA of HipAB toxin-antitoxin module
MAMTEIPAFKLARNPELTCHANHKVADRRIAAVSVTMLATKKSALLKSVLDRTPQGKKGSIHSHLFESCSSTGKSA